MVTEGARRCSECGQRILPGDRPENDGKGGEICEDCARDGRNRL